MGARMAQVVSRRMIGSVIMLALMQLSVDAGVHQAAQRPIRPRVVITADPELDDNNTIIRAILYSSDVQFEGLIYASSQFHWRGDGKGTTQYIAGREYTRLGLCPCQSWRFSPHERFIDNIVDAYATAYPNLKVHDPNYPSPAELKSKIKWGNVDFEGDFSKDSEGSSLIKSLLLDNRPGPLYVTAQGGESTIARALKSIYDQFAKTPQWQMIRNKVSHKLIIIPSGDQDGAGAGYIRPNWPEVRQFDFVGMDFGYGAQNRASASDKIYFSPEWTTENIASRGPLGALYRLWGDGKQMVKDDPTDYFGLSGYTSEELKKKGYMVWLAPETKGSFLGEGDTPTFLNLVDNGLRAYQGPAWGGWGGWARPGAPAVTAFGAPPPVSPPNTSGVAPGLASAGSDPNRPIPAKQDQPKIDYSNFHLPTVPPRTAEIASRFFAAAENDLAARMKWAVTPQFSNANHPPVVMIVGSQSIFARSSDTVKLEAIVSDPDHNEVEVRWWQYNDAGTYAGDIKIFDSSTLKASFRVPDDAKPGQTINVILEATDNGAPSLTRYQRLVVTVQ